MRNGLRNPATYDQDNPARPVDWRHQLVCELVAAEERLPKRLACDRFVREALQFERRRSRCETARQNFDLARRHPCLHTAWELHRENGFARWKLEAWLLTGEPLDVVAARCDLPSTVVDIYAGVFFDVADRLTATASVVSCAIGEKYFFGLTLEDTSVVLKTFGLFLGPVALQRLAPLLEHPPALPVPGEGLSAERVGELTDFLTVRLYMLTHSLPCDEHTLKRIRTLNEFAAVLDDIQAQGAISDRQREVLARLLELKWPPAKAKKSIKPKRRQPTFDDARQVSPPPDERSEFTRLGEAVCGVPW